MMCIKRRGFSIAIFVFISNFLTAQTPPELKIGKSADFSSPAGFVLENVLDYKDGYVVVSSNDENFYFQKFSRDLKFQKEHKVSIKERIKDKNSYEGFIQTKGGSYLLTREVHNDAHTEGVSALEFFPDQLDLTSQSKSLFQSSDKVAINRGTYDYFLSQDKSKLLITYRMVPKIRSSNVNKDVMGLFVLDEKLNKLWGAEYEMPYAELYMRIIDYAVSNDGKVFMTIKVFDNDDRDNTKRDGSPYHHLELLIFDKNTQKPQKIKIGLNGNFYKKAYVFEDAKEKICVSGLYGPSKNDQIKGVYLAKFSLEKLNGQSIEQMNTVEATLYEVPKTIVESANSVFNKNSTDMLNRLQLRSIEVMTDGSLKILTEEFRSRFNTFRRIYGFDPYTHNYKGYEYNPPRMTHAYSGDIYVFNITADEKLDWVKRIPKYQHRSDGDYRPLSFKSFAVGENLYVFFLDTKKNDNIGENDRAKQYHGRKRVGYLRGVSIDKDGNTKKFDAGYTKVRAIDFFIYYFKKGINDLIYIERTAKNNVLYVIQGS